MTKIRTHKNNHYIPIKYSVISNNKLSFGARGLYSYIICLGEDFDEKELTEVSKEDYLPYLDELLINGYVQRLEE